MMSKSHFADAGPGAETPAVMDIEQSPGIAREAAQEEDKLDRAKAVEDASGRSGTSAAEPAEPATPGRTDPLDLKDPAEPVSAKDVTLHAELSCISGWSSLPHLAGAASCMTCIQRQA